MNRCSKLFVAGLIAALSCVPLTACTAQAPEAPVTVQPEQPVPEVETEAQPVAEPATQTEEIAQQPEEPKPNQKNTVDWGPRRGIWRGEIELPGGKALSFNFVIEFTREVENQPIWEISLRNGAEVLPAMIENNNPLNIITFPGTDARIEATVNSSNTGLGGEYIYTHENDEGDAVEYRLPFMAQCSDSRRFAWLEAGEDDVATDRLAERWAVSFDQRTGPAIAELTTLPDGLNVLGSIKTLTEDDGQLAGSFEQGRLRLSRFTGGTGILYDGTIEPDGTLIGTFRSLAHHAEGFTASPDGEAVLESETDSKLAGE